MGTPNLSFLEWAQVAGSIAIGLIFLSLMHEPSKPPLRAKITHHGPHFEIINNDSYDWRRCTFRLNDDYTARRGSIAAGERALIRSADFTKSDGARFDFIATKPLRLFLSCDDANNKLRSITVGWN